MSNGTFTFWGLLERWKPEIPIIQRDYAQGRTDARTTQLRDDFLAALLAALRPGGAGLDLDLVYGAEVGEKLVLLDGQQRATTLWLLHWYLARRATGGLGRRSRAARPLHL